jgi:tRNA 2-selenouridine synthase
MHSYFDISMINIKEVYGKNYTFVDVRSPKEFEEDTIPGAVNIPLLLDDERAIVGTIYTKESKDKAMQVGMEFISKRLPEMFQEYNQLKQPIIIFCWRGGMRSGSITGLLKACGIDVQQLEGGYKTYRAFVREQLKVVEIPKSIVVYGHTGAGKTEVICQLDNGLDLEGLAEHRGSILGDIGLKPVGQKKFESKLLKRLNELKDEKFIVIECESRKIGKVEIPQKVFEKIKKPWKGIFLEKSVEERAKISRETYFPEANEKNINEIIAKLECIKKYLGGKNLDKVKKLLRENKITEAIKLLLVDYYDLHYVNSFGTFDYTVKTNEEFFDVVKKLVK